MHSTRSTTIAAFALLASILVATTPVAGSSHLAAGSSHTTTSDFQAGTLTNVSASDDTVSLDDAHIELEDWEDGDLTPKEWTGWHGDTSRLSNQQTVVLNDTRTGELQSQGGEANTVWINTSSTSEYSKTTLELQIDNQTAENGDNVDIELMDGTTTGAWLRFRQNGNVQYVGPGGTTTVGSWSEDTQYTVNIDDINFTSETYDIWLNNTKLADDVSFRNSVSGFNRLEVLNDANANTDTVNSYLDDIRVYPPTSTPEGTYISANHSVTDPEAAWANLTVENTTAHVTWQAHTSGSWSTVDSTTYTTTGNRTLDVSGTSADTWRVNVTFVTNDVEWTAELHDEGLLIDPHAPIVNNSSADPPDGEVLDDATQTVTIDIEDADFDLVHGDNVTATLHAKGSPAGSDTLTANGTASVTHTFEDIGETDYHWEVTDDYGETTTSQTFTVNVPSNITIRREDNASQIITNANITATFYSEDGQTVITRSDDNNDGNISLSGLPNTEFIVTVQADGYYDRRAYIQSILDQQNIYLLNTSDHPDAVDTTFVYEDRTGNFPPEGTALRVQRAVDVNNDNTSEWQTVAGDYWGAAGEFPFTGQYQTRYRLVIENTEQDRQRVLGTHIPSEDGSKNIIIGQIEWGAENATGRYFDAQLDTDDDQIEFLYEDPTEGTTDIRVRIHALGNESNEIHNQTYSNGPYGTFEAEIPITANQSEESWVVTYDATHDSDGAIQGQTTVGGSPFFLPVDAWLLGTLSWSLLTFIACLYGPRTATFGAWALVGMAGILMLFQWVTIPIASFVVAAVIAAGGTFYAEATP